MAKINSTIFKTFNSNIDSATSKIGLFNKSFHTMQRDLKTGNGVFTSIFGGKSITSNDIKSIQAMNNAMKGGATYAQAWQTHMKGATVAAKQQVVQCIKNKGSLTELTQGMKSATVASKAAAVGMNLLATAGNMIAFMAISKGIELLVNAIDEYIHAAEIAREKSSELTDSWVEENSSIDDSISKYKELREKLQDTSLTASEVKDVKEELLVVQQGLIDKYGQEALGIDLVNGKYDEQIAKLKELSKQKAQDYVAENYSNIQEDEKYVNEKVSLNASLGFKGTLARPDDYSGSGFDLGKYLERYDKLDAKVLNTDGQYSVSGTVSLVTSGTREEVYEQLSQLFNDLSNDFGESNEDVNKFKETLSGIIQDSFDIEQMEKSKDNIKKYAEAQILSQDGTRKLYEEAIFAVDKYNEALVSGEGVDEAKANLDSVKESVTSATSDISGASYVFDDIYSGINSTAERAHEITKAFENNASVKEYAEQLKGLSSDDLLKIDFEDNVTQAGEEAFTALMEVIGLSEDEVQALIDKLIELGYVQGSTLDNEITASFTSIFGSTEDEESLNSKVESYKAKINEIKESLNSILDGDATAEGISAIISKYGMVYDTVEEYVEALSKMQSQESDSVISIIDEEISKLDDTIDADVIAQLENLKETIFSFYDEQSSNKTNINQTIDDIKSLDEILKKVNNGESLSLVETSKLINKYPELKDSVKELADGYSLEAEKINDVINANKEYANSLVSAEVVKTQTMITAIKRRLKLLGIEEKDYDQHLKDFEKDMSTVETYADGTPKSYSGDGTGDTNPFDWDEFQNVEDIEKIKQYEEYLLELKNLYKEIEKTGDGSSKNSSSKSNTVFDWIEIKLENIAKKTDKLKEKFENSFKLSSTNTNFKKYLNQISSEISSNEKAISKYDAKLRSIGLEKKYVDKIKLGDYSIDENLPEKTQEKISEYQKWYDKKIACEEKILEKEKERAEAENSYAEKRVKYYEDEISKIESLIDKREKLVGIKESIGLSASKSDYSYSVNKSSEEISRLKKQAEELKKLQKGVEEGSDAWNTYQEGIESNNEKILDLIESIADLAEKLAQLPLDKARKITENNVNKSELYELKSDNSNSYGSKNKYLDKQTQLAKSDAKAWSNALKNAQNNIKTLWYSGGVSSARKTSANKNKKEGELLSTAGLVVGSAAYNAVIKYNKAILAKQEAETESAKATENATKTLRENTKAKYDNMANAYSTKRDVYSSQADRFQSKLDYINAKNMKNDKNLIKSTYNSILKASKNELSVLEDERKKYDLDKIRKQYENGELSLDDYRELVSYVNELDSSIYDAKTNLEELKDTIREETVFKPFVEMREDIEKTIDSVEKLISLINDDSLFNDDGSLTSLGTAKFSLLSQQLNKSKETIQSYQDQIKAATSKYQEFLNGADNGYSEEEYQKDIQELNSGLLDSLIESKSITDEIISMHTQQQQAIIDSIKEEINARSEALQKKKEYYDYDKQIRNKTKDIESLEAQKAALLATEDSLEKRRKLLELEEELNNKREELEETQKEHEINLVVNGLNDFSDDIQNQFDEYTKNLASSFEEQIKIIQNANLMYSQGYSSIFKTLNDVLGFYGSQFDASSFTPNLAPTTSTLTPTNMIDLSSMDSFINSNITPILTLPKLNIPDVENRANSSNIDINFGNLININGNVNSETVDELKRMMPKITKQVTNSIVEDLRKNGFK